MSPVRRTYITPSSFEPHASEANVLSEYEALVKNVIKKSLGVRPKESVIVETWNHGFDVAREAVYQLRAAGAKPLLLFEDEETHWRSVEGLPASKLGQVSKSEWAAVAAADAYIFLPGPADIARYRRNTSKMDAAFAYNDEWYRRGEKSGLRGARILLGYISPERAAAYGLDYGIWRQMVLEAGSGDAAAIARHGRKIADALTSDAEVEISAANGTRLTFRLKGRDAKSDDGIVDKEDLKAGDFMTNVPPGQAYVAPDEGSAEGTFVADLPTPYLGTFVRGLRVTFTDGRASWAAEENPEPYLERWGKAKGPKDRIGALGIGLNPLMQPGFLQNDLVAGSVELGVGANTGFGGKNKTDFYLGAYLSNATVKIGRKTIVRDGHLAV